MKSGLLPTLTFLIGAAALAAALLVYAQGFDPTASDLVVGPAGPVTRPNVVDDPVASVVTEAIRPTGLRELSVVSPDRILLEDQRASLAQHLAAVKLSLNVPDAMSYAARREGKLMVLSAASGPSTGLIVFSEKKGARLTHAKTFLKEYFRGVFTLNFDGESKFLSRFAGEMDWMRGSSSSGARFDAYLIHTKRGGPKHLLFIQDPTVANATRRMIVDSVKIAR